MQAGLDLIDPFELNESAFRLIGKEWMLITSGKIDHYNMMTASWGSLGFFWNKPIAVIFVRPQRYTYDFLEKNDLFTLSFFDNEHRKLLNVLGSSSGREIKKMEMKGLDAIESAEGAVYFQQARLVMECKKIYFSDISPAGFLDEAAPNIYPNKDYHRMYFGEVINARIRK